MGNKISRKRDGSTATEQQSAEESGMTQTQEDTKIEDLDVVVGEPVKVVARLPNEECISKCKEASAATQPTQNDTEQEPKAKEASAPVENEPLAVSEMPVKLEPVAAAQLAPESVPEPEPTSNQDLEIEAFPEPISQPVPTPATTLEKHSATLTEESLTEPELSPIPSNYLGVPDVTLEPANSSPAPATIHTQVHADKPLDILVSEECLHTDEAEAISMFDAEKTEETSESLEEHKEAKEDLEQSDVKDDVSELLKNLELEGNYTDLIPGDVNIHDDNPITDISTSASLM